LNRGVKHRKHVVCEGELFSLIGHLILKLLSRPTIGKWFLGRFRNDCLYCPFEVVAWDVVNDKVTLRCYQGIERTVDTSFDLDELYKTLDEYEKEFAYLDLDEIQHLDLKPEQVSDKTYVTRSTTDRFDIKARTHVLARRLHAENRFRLGRGGGRRLEILYRQNLGLPTATI
jgi:hypothetical protein